MKQVASSVDDGWRTIDAREFNRHQDITIYVLQHQRLAGCQNFVFTREKYLYLIHLLILTSVLV